MDAPPVRPEGSAGGTPGGSGTPGQAGMPGRRPGDRARARARPVPELSEEHGHLTLTDLRAYRAALQAEENNVSYWRRILQARLDVVREGRTDGGGAGSVSAAALRPLLTDERVGRGRRALVEVVPVDDIPPLPDLAELWDRCVEPDDTEGLLALEEHLSSAERQLSAYRTALHARQEAATADLIARYRVEPGLCLSSLPLAPRRGGTT